jgi:hypothetical protein
MRHPLLKPEEIEETQRWLFISLPPAFLITRSDSRSDVAAGNRSAATVKKSQVPIKTTPKKPIPSVDSKVAPGPHPFSPTSVPSISKKPISSVATVTPRDVGTIDPLDPSSAVSYRVLEWIIEKTQSQIKLSANKQHDLDELQDRLLSAQTQLTLLATQIETGVMTMEQYVRLLENRLSQDRVLVTRLEQQGELSLVKLVKEKIRHIEEELSEAEQNVDSSSSPSSS